MSKKQIRILISFLFLFLIWQYLAMKLQNSIILPYPKEVLVQMLTQLQSTLFYDSIVQTFLRIVLGFLIALGLATLLSFLSYFYPWFADLFYPILLLTRSIPNISYILIVLFWFSAQTSVMIITFLILFPTIYANLYQGLVSFPKEFQDVMKVYPAPKTDEIFHVYLPYLRPYIFASTNAGLSLSLKVGIMAEILGQARTGIGRQLNICRLNLDMAGVFAWTIWIILLLFLIERAISYLTSIEFRKKYKA